MQVLCLHAGREKNDPTNVMLDQQFCVEGHQFSIPSPAFHKKNTTTEALVRYKYALTDMKTAEQSRKLNWNTLWNYQNPSTVN